MQKASILFAELGYFYIYAFFTVVTWEPADETHKKRMAKKDRRLRHRPKERSSFSSFNHLTNYIKRIKLIKILAVFKYMKISEKDAVTFVVIQLTWLNFPRLSA